MKKAFCLLLSLIFLNILLSACGDFTYNNSYTDSLYTDSLSIDSIDPNSYCPRYGYKVDDSDIYCRACGFKLQNDVEEPSRQDSSYEVQILLVEVSCAWIYGLEKRH